MNPGDGSESSRVLGAGPPAASTPPLKVDRPAGSGPVSLRELDDRSGVASGLFESHSSNSNNENPNDVARRHASAIDGLLALSDPIVSETPSGTTAQSIPIDERTSLADQNEEASELNVNQQSLSEDAIKGESSKQDIAQAHVDERNVKLLNCFRYDVAPSVSTRNQTCVLCS